MGDEEYNPSGYDPNFKRRPVGFTADIEPKKEIGRWRREEVRLNGDYFAGYLFEPENGN